MNLPRSEHILAVKTTPLLVPNGLDAFSLLLTRSPAFRLQQDHASQAVAMTINDDSSHAADCSSLGGVCFGQSMLLSPSCNQRRCRAGRRRPPPSRKAIPSTEEQKQESNRQNKFMEPVGNFGVRHLSRASRKCWVTGFFGARLNSCCRPNKLPKMLVPNPIRRRYLAGFAGFQGRSADEQAANGQLRKRRPNGTML